MRASGCNNFNPWPYLLLSLGALVSTPVTAQVAHNPGYDRPGLGFTPAVLHAGDVMLEQGLPDWSRAGGDSLYNADTLLRVGIGASMELQLGSGWNRLESTGISGRGDTTLAIKYAPATSGSFSWGLLGSLEFTDGAQAFRAMHPQYLLGASANWQRSDTHALGLYVEAEHGDGDGQLLAVNSSWATTPTVGTYVEVAMQHADGTGDGSMAGAGLTWQATPRVQFDLSARHRLSGHADTWQGGVGFAIYFGD